MTQPMTHIVHCAAAIDHLAVAHGDAAKTEHQLRVLCDRAPIHQWSGYAFGPAHDVRQQRLRRADGIGRERIGETAGGRQHPLHLGLGMMEPPGGGPAVAAAEHACPAVHLSHAREFLRHQRDGGVPVHRHERVIAAQRAAQAVAIQPALAHVGAVDAVRRVYRLRCAVDDRRRREIACKRPHIDDASVPHHRVECTPVRGVWQDLIHEPSVGALVVVQQVALGLPGSPTPYRPPKGRGAP